MKDRHRFAFACAIDESGCGFDLAYPEWGGGRRMRELLRDSLKERASWDKLAQEVLVRDLVRFAFFTGGDHGHPYSSCSFPNIIAAHSREMGASFEKWRPKLRQSGHSSVHV